MRRRLRPPAALLSPPRPPHPDGRVLRALAEGVADQAQDESVLFYKISENSMEFPPDVFGTVSPLAVDLIKGLTKTDPAERLTCEAALQHGWLAEGAAAGATLSEAAAGNRRKSLARRKSKVEEPDPAALDALASAAAAPAPS